MKHQTVGYVSSATTGQATYVVTEIT